MVADLLQTHAVVCVRSVRIIRAGAPVRYTHPAFLCAQPPRESRHPSQQGPSASTVWKTFL